MDFKKWLLKLEIGDNYGADLPLHRPERRLAVRPGPGAMPTHGGEPLPGNKKPMKKKMKKGK
jgi:hypothetical protein